MAFIERLKGISSVISGSSPENPKPGFTAVATINAASILLAKAFAEQGIPNGIQVNSVSPGPTLSNRRINFLNKWSTENNLTEWMEGK